MRCTFEDCESAATKACQSRRCDDHCSTELTGVKCSKHKGTRAQPANPDEILPSSTSVKKKGGKSSVSSTTPTEFPRGRQAGNKPSRGQGISFSYNLDHDWETARETADGYAVADRSARNNMARVYSQQEAQKVTVYYWEQVRSRTIVSRVPLLRLTYGVPIQDGVVPQVARDYLAPHYPFFHPKDQKDLASAVTRGGLFEYYDFPRGTWTRTNIPCRVGGNEASVLHIRAPTVTNCPGLPSLPFLPSTPRKRSVYDSDIEEYGSGAPKLSRSSSSSSITDSRCVFTWTSGFISINSRCLLGCPNPPSSPHLV